MGTLSTLLPDGPVTKFQRDTHHEPHTLYTKKQNMAEVCSNPSCSEPGTLRCGGCKDARYCSRDCQRSRWTAHKAACKAKASKSNCYVLGAAAQTATAPVLDNIAAQIVPFHLSDLGDEVKEKRQLERQLGWKGSMEVGKFYDHKGEDGWYYYAYGDARAFDSKSGLPVNEAAGLVCYQRPVYGDIGIVRSGPVGAEFAEEFSKLELARAVGFYRKNDKDRVFSQREMSRASRKYKWPVAT